MKISDCVTFFLRNQGLLYMIDQLNHIDITELKRTMNTITRGLCIHIFWKLVKWSQHAGIQMVGQFRRQYV